MNMVETGGRAKLGEVLTEETEVRMYYMRKFIFDKKMINLKTVY